MKHTWPKTYYEAYMDRGQCSVIEHLNRNRHLLNDCKVFGQDIWEVPNHPPFDKFNEYGILKVDITKKKIVHILIGNVLCNFTDGRVGVWFEIALSQSKEKLEIWKDLNVVVKSNERLEAGACHKQIYV